MKDFDWLYQHVLERFGSARELEALLPKPATASQDERRGNGCSDGQYRYHPPLE